MELFEFVLEQTLRFILGLCGFIVLACIVEVLNEGIYKVVEFIENRINAIRKTYSLHK